MRGQPGAALLANDCVGVRLEEEVEEMENDNKGLADYYQAVLLLSRPTTGSLHNCLHVLRLLINRLIPAQPDFWQDARYRLPKLERRQGSTWFQSHTISIQQLGFPSIDE